LGILDGSEIPAAMRELKQIQKELEEQIRNASQKERRGLNEDVRKRSQEMTQEMRKRVQ